MQTFEPNPRAVVGGNNPPPEDVADDFISKRMIAKAARYLQFAFPDLENLLVKRKGLRPMVYRHVMVSGLRGLVPSESMARHLGINRKTMGENGQRPVAWSNITPDVAERLGLLMQDVERFDVILEHISEAIHHHVLTDVEEADRLLMLFGRIDPALRRIERQVKAAEFAALEADRAEADLREKQRIRQAGALRTQLKGISNKDAIIAKHRGTKDTAERLTPEALAVLETLSVRASKGVKTLTSEVNAAGLKECLRLGLAQDAEPHLSKATDRAVSIMEFGGLVYLEAIALDLIAKPKRQQRKA